MEVKVSVRKIRVEATSPREIKVAVGGGARCVVDDEVTELSPNPVKSSGIWAFVTGLINSLTSWISSTFSTKDELPHFSDTFTGDGSEQDPYDVELPDAIIPDFNPHYFKGAGTALDPIDLRVGNLPSGGGAQEKRFVEIKIGEGEEVKQIDITKWSDGTDLDLDNGKFYKFEYFVNGGHWTSINFGDFTGDFHIRSSVLTGFIRFTMGANEYYTGTMTFKISNNVIIGTCTNANRTTTPTNLTERHSFTNVGDISTYLPFGKVTLLVNGGQFEVGTVIRLEEI